MENKNGCAVCGKDLLYLDKSEEGVCVFCRGTSPTQAKCSDGHFVCDTCHALPANELIERFTTGSSSKEPLGMAIALMKSPAVKMHGPEHHFLVPAVLLSAFSNATGRPADKAGMIEKARQRAQHVLGGFCGFYGNCGAAVGTGIFVSVLTNATPLSKEEWRLSNLMCAASLHTIAEAGGPRCCKRNSFLAIEEALKFVKEHMFVDMGKTADRTKCEFSHLNKECKKEECRFYRQ